MRLARFFASFSVCIVTAVCASWLHSQNKEGGAVKEQGVETPMATDERLEGSGWWPTKGTASRDKFVGTKECARCHAKITATQLTTPMARAASLAADSQVLREHARISREMGPYAYEIASAQGTSNYSVSNGADTASVQIGWAFGLGNKGQTYVYQRGGLYYESRVSFYNSLQGLDLTTGHENTTPRNLDGALGRLLDSRSVKHCFGCHTTGSTTRAGFDPAHATMGVTCEACHGPGAKHAELMDEEKNEEGRASIFDPAGLSAVVQADFCGGLSPDAE
jgi:Cytochrome c554 and c-prime